MKSDSKPIDSPKDTPRKSGNRIPWKRLLLATAIVLLFVLSRRFQFGEKLAAVRSWIEELGPWGPLAYVLMYSAAVVAAVPGSAITVAGGALFGTFKGTILVSLGATVGAGIAFLISRHLAREAVASWLEKNEKFQKLDRMTEKHGALIVALTRLVPIFPFNLLNYGFGLTRVKFSTYIFWSWLCMLPGTVFYVSGASALTETLSSGEIPWKTVLALTGASAVLAVLMIVARKKLKETDNEEEDKQNPNEEKTG